MIESTITLLKKFDKRKKIEEDFEWVIKIVSSSENFNHIVVSNRLFNVFSNKWRNHLSENKLKEYSFMFEQEKTITIGQFL
jgi:hypothetical protein